MWMVHGKWRRWFRKLMVADRKMFHESCRVALKWASVIGGGAHTRRSIAKKLISLIIHINHQKKWQPDQQLQRYVACLQTPVSYSHAFLQVFRTAFRPRHNPLLSSRFASLQTRFLSQETRQAIDKAVESAPVVLFMKGTPEMPQCGFSRASIQILGLQGVNPAKFTAFNVLEDEELRAGRFMQNSHTRYIC